MIEKIIEKVKAEPVRLRIYLVLVAVATYALARGYVQPTDVEFLCTVGALILGVERSRSKVSPTP